jgi:hypothetical protein
MSALRWKRSFQPNQFWDPKRTMGQSVAALGSELRGGLPTALGCELSVA